MKSLKFLPLVLAVALVACGEKNTTKEPVGADKSASASAVVTVPATPVAPQPAPAASVAGIAVATPTTADLAKGEKIYTATCMACHGAGVLGAPKFGDKAAWQPRIATGIDTLHTNALNGVKMMPPRGGNAALKDDEVTAAADYMVSKAR